MSSAKSSSGGQKAYVDRLCYHNILVVGAAGWSTPCLLSQTLGPHAIVGPPHPLPCWLMPLPWLKRICMPIKVSHTTVSSTEWAKYDASRKGKSQDSNSAWLAFLAISHHIFKHTYPSLCIWLAGWLGVLLASVTTDTTEVPTPTKLTFI